MNSDMCTIKYILFHKCFFLSYCPLEYNYFISGGMKWGGWCKQIYEMFTVPFLSPLLKCVQHIIFISLIHINGRSMNRLRTNALQNVQQHGCQPEIN